MARKKGERRDTFLIESPAERELPNRKEKKKKKKIIPQFQSPTGK